MRVHDKQHGQPQKAASAEKNLLSMAAAAGNIEAVDEVNRADPHGRTPLYNACRNGQVEAARLLLDKGAEVDRADPYGWTPLHIACAEGHVEAARLVLTKGADVNRANKDGLTPLYIACANDHVDAVRLLLEKSAEVDRANKLGGTPLFIACENGRVDAVRLLLDNGADAIRATKKGKTALDIAKLWRQRAVVALLEEHLESKFALHAAARTGDVDAMTQLLDGGAAVDQAMKDGCTPLYVVCWKGHVGAVRLLLEKGAEVDRADENGRTPLYIACDKGHVDAARLLLEKGAEVDRAMKNGATPLWTACGNGHVDVARLLLARGADAERANQQGTTPLDAAKKCRHDAVVALIEDHLYKADIDATPYPPERRCKNLANMIAGKKRALQERDEALEQATKRAARVEQERDDHESREKLLDSMVLPLEEQRRQLQEIVGDAAKALINRGVPTRVLPDDDTPFYYARNSWDTEQRVPWNAEAGRPMSLAEGIAWLHDHG